MRLSTKACSWAEVMVARSPPRDWAAARAASQETAGSEISSYELPLAPVPVFQRTGAAEAAEAAAPVKSRAAEVRDAARRDRDGERLGERVDERAGDRAGADEGRDMGYSFTT